MLDFDPPPGLSGRLDPHVDSIFGKQLRDAIRPFDDHNAALFEQFGEADGFEIFGPVDAVGVEMVDRELATGVDVEQNEGGTGDGAGVAAETADEAAHELGLAGAELAVEGDAGA